MKAGKVYRPEPAQPIDEALFDRMATAARVRLSKADRATLRAVLTSHNALPALQREYARRNGCARARGRPRALDIHALAVGLLWVLERAGGRITAHSPRENQNITVGKAAAFLRVAWKAIESPRITQDGFARLVERAWREPRTKARQARETALETQRNAWRN